MADVKKTHTVETVDVALLRHWVQQYYNDLRQKMKSRLQQMLEHVDRMDPEENFGYVDFEAASLRSEYEELEYHIPALIQALKATTSPNSHSFRYCAMKRNISDTGVTITLQPTNPQHRFDDWIIDIEGDTSSNNTRTYRAAFYEAFHHFIEIGNIREKALTSPN